MAATWHDAAYPDGSGSAVPGQNIRGRRLLENWLSRKPNGSVFNSRADKGARGVGISTKPVHDTNRNVA